MEIAKLEALITGDVKPLTAALNEAKTQLTNFGNSGATSLRGLNTGLSITAKNAITAATDIRSMLVALDVLQAEQSKIRQGTAAWFEYETEIRKVNGQLTVLEAQLPVVAAEMKVVGTTSAASLSSVGKGLTGALSGLRSIAYILPGIGIAGLFNLAFEAIKAAADALGIFNSEAKKLAEATDRAADGYADEAAKVAILVTELKSENFSRQEKERIIKELQAIAPAYFGNLKLEGDTVKNLVDDYGRYGQAIILVSKIKGASSLVEENQLKVIQKQLEISKSLAFVEANRAKFHDAEAFIMSELERDLEGRTRLAKEIAPVMAIILEAQKELNELGGDPNNPLNPEKLKKVKKELEAINNIDLTAWIRPLGFANEIFRETGDALAPVERDLTRISTLKFPSMNDFLDKLNNTLALKKFNEQLKTAKDIASELAGIFADMFTDLVTTGRISFQKLAQEVARFIGKLVEAVIQAALLKIIMAAITGGTSAAIPAGHSFGGGLFGNAEGGIFTQPTLLGNHIFGEAGPEVLIPLNQLSSLVGNMGGNMVVSGDFRVHGSDLVLALNRGNVRINRNYGNNFNN